jgi:hypothetical protein
VSWGIHHIIGWERNLTNFNHKDTNEKHTGTIRPNSRQVSHDNHITLSRKTVTICRKIHGSISDISSLVEGFKFWIKLDDLKCNNQSIS